MKVQEAIKSRRSIRAFQDKEIPKESIDKLKEAIIWAPSAGNLQARKFYFVFNKEIKEQIVNEARTQQFLKEAPLITVCCKDLNRVSRYGEKGKSIYSVCDVSASIENLMLQAVELGLGTCWVGSFDEEKVSEILNMPDHIRPIALVPVGYPNEEPEAPERININEAIEEI